MNIPFKQYWDLLAKYLKMQRGLFALLTVLLLGSIGLQVFNPQLIRNFIDTALAGSSTEKLATAALIFMAAALLQQVVSVSARYVGESVAWTATNHLRSELARHCLDLDMSYHNDTSPGELIERIDGDVSQLSNFFSQLVIRVIGNILLLIGIVVALAFEDWRLGGIFVIYTFTTLWVLNRVRGLAIPHQKAFRESTTELFGFLEERLSGTEDVRSSGAVAFVIRGLYARIHDNFIHWRKGSRMFLVIRVIAGGLLVLGNVIALLAGYTLFVEGVIQIGTVYLLIHYVNLLRRPIREITQQVENLQNIGAAVERLKELKAIETKLVDGNGTKPAEGPLELTFDKVLFSYVDGDPVIQDLSFQLSSGKVLGLLGRTGSGKTTLARLIFRLYDPVQGTISLNNTNIRDTQLALLRRSVAIVTQDVQLFQASVRDNLTFFDESITDEEIMGVIDNLELGEWFEGLSDGLDTRLETGGRGLSAGEAQLLAFTRVFLRNPGLVILDEASSRLDPATEQLIERAVDKLLEDRTAIIIAHRLGTVQRTDNIMILEDGQIAEFGEREQLANDPSSRFANLLQTGLAEVLV